MYDTPAYSGRFAEEPVHDDPLYFTVRADRFEYRDGDHGDGLLWDVQARLGRDYHRVYVESEGEWGTDEEDPESADVELLYGRAVSAFWDLRAGLRHDLEPTPERSFLVLGVMGIAPYWFEIETNLNLSEDGDVLVDLEAEYDLLFSQRLILQPRLETQVALQDQPAFGLGEGFTDVELGARLRWEIHRKFAPYVGVSWESALGETEKIVERAGEDPDGTALVAGIRAWF